MPGLGILSNQAQVHEGKAPSDGELIAEVLAGQTGAFTEIVSRHRGWVERLCSRFFSDREMVRDMAQESFIRTFAGLSGYRQEMPFRAWLRAVVANVCYDELRRRQRRPEDLLPDLEQSELAWAQLVNEASPEDIAEAAEARQEAQSLARKLLDALRPDDRMVITLKETEGLSVGEIANLMGWSEAKVKIRAFRARQLMRRRAEQIFTLRRSAVIRWTA
jgi:RNA polymerase sigma-70 factor (ECF subfamily)